MTTNAEELLARLGPRRGPGGGPPPPRLPIGPKLRAAARAILIGVLGAAVCVGLLLDRPSIRAPAAAAPSAADRFAIAPDALPTTADGRPLTYGELFDLYGLEDERLRQSLEATFQRPFGLDEARRYRATPVGRRSVTVVLRAEAAR
jgi:hypothetical protein